MGARSGDGSSGNGSSEDGARDALLAVMLLAVPVVVAIIVGRWAWSESMPIVFAVLFVLFAWSGSLILSMVLLGLLLNSDDSPEQGTSKREPSRVQQPPTVRSSSKRDKTVGQAAARRTEQPANAQDTSFWPSTGWGWWIALNAASVGLIFVLQAEEVPPKGVLLLCLFLPWGVALKTQRYLGEPPGCPIRPESLWWLRFFAFFVPIIGLALTVVYLTRPSEAEQHMGLGFLTLWLWGLALEVAAYLLLM